MNPGQTAQNKVHYTYLFLGGRRFGAVRPYVIKQVGPPMEITQNSQSLHFDSHGLIPAIVQDHYTKEVLTLAYMNAETLALTIAEGRTVFWSRSRQEIWRKGETSGNVQRVVSITADCDADALVVEVVKSGPACHTGAESCFFNPVYVSDELKQFSWQGLSQLIKGRRTQPQEGRYTPY